MKNKDCGLPAACSFYTPLAALMPVHEPKHPEELSNVLKLGVDP
jgi:hypothetical protein